MLRRNSTKGLERRKSTSSAHSKYESMDPEVARHFAHTAAVLAYNRAQQRDSADGNHRAGGPQQYSRSQDQEPISQSSLTTNNSHGVRRQQSVRFAGPNAVQRRQSVGSRAVAPILQQKSSTITLRPMAMTTNTPVPAAFRPPSRSSSIGKAYFVRTTAASFMAGDPFDEYYTREDDVASTPSSYRRIRKAKSMFSPLKAPSAYYANGSPGRQESTYTRDYSTFLNPLESPTGRSGLVLRAPKSMSFLRVNRTRRQLQQNDEAVQIARDRFFQETAQQRLKEQPSFLFRSRAQRQEKAFRKSVRSSSGDHEIAVASDKQVPTMKVSGLRTAARKASKTFKRKLKKVFGKSKDEPISIPNQQLDARESHVRKDNDDGQEQYNDIPYPDKASLSSVATRNPSLHAVNSNQRLRSFAGSVKSARSIKTVKSNHSDERSRVTSWSSTGVGTIASQPQRPPPDRDQHRLSIIDEIGAHIPSSSIKRLDLQAQFFGSQPIHLPQGNSGNIPLQAPKAQINSARVYSALMKRLDENTPDPNPEVSQETSIKNQGIPSLTPQTRKSLEVSPGSPGSRTPATIRHVIPDDSIDGRSQGSVSHDHQWVRANSISSAKAETMFGYTGEHVHQWRTADTLREARMRNSDDVFSPKNDSPRKNRIRATSSSSNKENLPPGDHGFDRTKTTVSAANISRQDSTKTSYHTVPETYGFTPQQLAIQNEPTISEKRRLRDSRSTFFGGKSVTVLGVTSPYRRAMAEFESGQLTNANPHQITSQLIKRSMYLDSDSAFEGNTGNEQSSERAYSDSVYSRNTNGHPAGRGSVLSLPFDTSQFPDLPLSDSGAGDVVIVGRSVYRPSKPDSGHRRGNDSLDSSEWKKWMSSEVAKLERTKQSPAGSYINYALPTMPRYQQGHFRERAQIHDDDDDEAGLQPRKAFVAKQPLSVIQQRNPNIQNPSALKPILKKQSTLSMRENTTRCSSPSNIPVPAPPPIPPRSPLRIMPSRTSIRSQATPVSTTKAVVSSGRNVLHKRNTSQATLRSVKSFGGSVKSVNKETPAKLVKRRKLRYSGAHTPLSNQSVGLDGANDWRSASRSGRGSITPAGFDYGPGELEEMYGGEGGRVLVDPIMGVSGRPASDMGRGELGSGKKEIRRRESVDVSYVEDEQAQVKGSRMMVDLFLNSRRRRIASGSGSANSSERGGSGSVFL